MKRLMVVMATVALIATGCGGSASSPGSGSGAQRTVLVDYKHDEFASSFLSYFPNKVTVRPGDRVTFKQAWSGEPHSVTMGSVVDSMFEFAPILDKYDSEEAARADGVSEETITRVKDTISKFAPMTDEGNSIYQPGAQPCFVKTRADLPAFSDAGDKLDKNAKCPTAGKPQPAFDGTEALYNSGFIPFQGTKGNTFELPIAADAKPGTYRYFCNYHWMGMSGTVEVVAKGKPIPSDQEVARQARTEIAKATKSALAAVRRAKTGDLGKTKAPSAGLDTPEQDIHLSVNEFFPPTVAAKAGKPVTWTLAGSRHTISFNVPKYFPIFTVAKNGTVSWDPKSHQPVAWTVLEPVAGPNHGDNVPRNVDVGAWDGGGGFHSSGVLDSGETFTMTFTKPGTYLYACVLHPPMVGKVVVKA